MSEHAGFINGYSASESYSTSFVIDSIKEIKVFLTNTTDKVQILTNLPNPLFPKDTFNGNLIIEFYTQANYGEEYVKKVFKINPNVINIR